MRSATQAASPASTGRGGADRGDDGRGHGTGADEPHRPVAAEPQQRHHGDDAGQGDDPGEVPPRRRRAAAAAASRPAGPNVDSAGRAVPARDRRRSPGSSDSKPDGRRRRRSGRGRTATHDPSAAPRAHRAGGEHRPGQQRPAPRRAAAGRAAPGCARRPSTPYTTRKATNTTTGHDRACAGCATVRTPGSVGQDSNSSSVPSRAGRVTARWTATIVMPASGWANHGDRPAVSQPHLAVVVGVQRRRRPRRSRPGSRAPTPNHALKRELPRLDPAEGGRHLPARCPAPASTGCARRPAPSSRCLRRAAADGGRRATTTPSSDGDGTTKHERQSRASRRRRAPKKPAPRRRTSSAGIGAAGSRRHRARRRRRRRRRAAGSRPRRWARPARRRRADRRCGGPGPRR